MTKQKTSINRKKRLLSRIASLLLGILSLTYIIPLFLILTNSFKKRTAISLEPFSLPNADTWVAGENYLSGINDYDFLSGIWASLTITVLSTLLILLCTSMFAWYITRVRNIFTKALFILCVFSMVVPFQMVMYTLSFIADRLNLNTPVGIPIIYLGFGTGLAVFMFCGFIKSVPLEIEEAASMDGCKPIRAFFTIILPIMKPTYITVGILQAMWIWNDFLLPYLVLDRTKYTTIPILIQSMQGSFGRVDMGAIMACLVLAVIPIIIFYFLCQKHIIKGVTEGSVKG
jgi:raffinose/stachyose/melibiose transport system permease protein